LNTSDSGVYKRIVDTLDEGVYMVDLERRITYWNSGAEQLTGYSAEEVLGRSCCDDLLQHITDREHGLCARNCPMMCALSGDESVASELYLRHKSGHRVPVRVRVMPIRSAEGKPVAAVQIFSDNRATIAAEMRIARLEREAMLDPLTSLGNRRRADQQLAHRLDELDRYGWPFGVIFVDIDNFKTVNDSFGHDVGDEVLRMIARDLSVDTRETDHVCRWGGEEFLVIVLNVDENRLQYIANKLRYLVEQSGFESEGNQVRVTVSVGATMAVRGESREELLRRADALMYHSKQTGRNRVSTRLPADLGR